MRYRLSLVPLNENKRVLLKMRMARELTHRIGCVFEERIAIVATTTINESSICLRV